MWRVQAWTAVPKHVADRVSRFGAWFHGRLHSRMYEEDLDTVVEARLGRLGGVPNDPHVFVVSDDGECVVALVPDTRHNGIQLSRGTCILWTVYLSNDCDPQNVDLSHDEVFVTIKDSHYAAMALHRHDGTVSRFIGDNLCRDSYTPKDLKVVHAQELWVTMFQQDRVLGFRLLDGVHVWSLRLEDPLHLVYHQDLVVVCSHNRLLVVRACDCSVLVRTPSVIPQSLHPLNDVMWVDTRGHRPLLKLFRPTAISSTLCRISNELATYV